MDNNSRAAWWIATGVALTTAFVGAVEYYTVKPIIEKANAEKSCDLYRISDEGQRVENTARAAGQKTIMTPQGQGCTLD